MEVFFRVTYRKTWVGLPVKRGAVVLGRTGVHGVVRPFSIKNTFNFLSTPIILNNFLGDSETPAPANAKLKSRLKIKKYQNFLSIIVWYLLQVV